MKTLYVYEPAPCCESGVFDYCVFCGCDCCDCAEPSRITLISENLKKNGVLMQRYDLGNSPKEFIDNADINKLLIENGKGVLPVTIVDGKIVKTKEYPLVEEIAIWLGIPDDCFLRKDDIRL